jgi:hypothetical protein
MAQAALIVGGAAVVYGMFGGGGTDLTIKNNVTNNLVATSMISSTTNCFPSSTSSNTINVAYNAPPGYTDAALSGGGCLQCYNGLNLVLKKREEARQHMGLPPENSLVAFTTAMTNPDPDHQGVNSVDLSNPCGPICTEIMIGNITQSNHVTVTENCNDTNNLSTNMSNSIKESVQSQLSNQQDIFGQLGSIFAGTRASIATNFANTMTMNVNVAFLNQLHTITNASNTFSVKGVSIYANNIQQSIDSTTIASMNVSNSVVDQLTQSSDFGLSQTLKNINDSTGDLANAFLNIISSIDDMLSTITGQLLLIIGAILLCILLIVGSLYLFSHQFATMVNEKIEGKIAEISPTQKTHI